jgi:uncharacterized membrane protein
MDHHRQLHTRAPRRQAGGMSVTIMLVLAGLVLMLGLVEIGYLFWAKRDTQKVADLASLAGAQSLETCTADGSDNLAGRGNAVDDNGFGGDLQLECGVWSADLAVEERFRAAATPAGRNAVRATATRPLVPFFGAVPAFPMVRAQAVAVRVPPHVAFSVGAQLLRVNGAAPLLTTLSTLGVDLDQTTAVDYNGLAQVRTTPAGLLQALGIPLSGRLSAGELDSLLASRQVSLGQLLDASADIISRDNAANLDLGALRNALGAGLDMDALGIRLGSTTAQPGGLFARLDAGQLASPEAALATEINLLEVLNTGILIAGQGRAAVIPGLNLLGLVQAQAAVIEPPSIAIGPVGARAYNAQVRVKLDIDSNNIPGLNLLTGVLGMQLKLPVHLDLVNAMGTLESVDCRSTPHTATIRVDSSILRTCVGRIPSNQWLSTSDACAATQDEVLLRLFGNPVVEGRLTLPALAHTDHLTLHAGQTGSTRPNALALDATVDALVGQLLGVLAGSLNPSPGTPTGNTAAQLADRYLAAAGQQANGRYNLNNLLANLRDEQTGIPQWTISNGVPSACGALNLGTCWSDGPVFTAFERSVTGQGLGLLGSITSGLLGGLVVNNCNSLVGGLTWNNCVRQNLTSYLQTAPAGVLDAAAANGGFVDPNTGGLPCSGLLCSLLRPVLEVLRPVLRAISALLRTALYDVLGLELGRTDVHVQSIQCKPVRIVQ